MQNEKTTGEIEHNIPGGELVLVLVIESKVRSRKSFAHATEVRNPRRKIDHAVKPKLVMARSYDAALQHTSRLR